MPDTELTAEEASAILRYIDQLWSDEVQMRDADRESALIKLWETTYKPTVQEEE